MEVGGKWFLHYQDPPAGVSIYSPLAVKGCPLTTPTGGPGIFVVFKKSKTSHRPSQSPTNHNKSNVDRCESVSTK